MCSLSLCVELLPFSRPVVCEERRPEGGTAHLAIASRSRLRQASEPGREPGHHGIGVYPVLPETVNAMLWGRPEIEREDRNAKDLPPAMHGIDLVVTGHTPRRQPPLGKRVTVPVGEGALNSAQWSELPRRNSAPVKASAARVNPSGCV